MEKFQKVFKNTYGDIRKVHRNRVNELRSKEHETFSRIGSAYSTLRSQREAY